MSGTTWSKFYWSDWRSDPGLRLCSIAARGLWIDMLCIAAEHDPVGYVALGGKPLDAAQIARMTGCPVREVSKLVAELEGNGVFSRDRRGCIYSRRMISDARKLALARENGNAGGNPKLKGGYNKPGFIYLMGVRSDGAYKIGISNNPTNRLKKVRAQYQGQDIAVLDQAPVDDMGAKEAEIHAMFDHCRSGEWFFMKSVDIGKVRTLFETLKGSEKGPEKDPPNPQWHMASGIGDSVHPRGSDISPKGRNIPVRGSR